MVVVGAAGSGRRGLLLSVEDELGEEELGEVLAWVCGNFGTNQC
jgi:hypothetical protein